MQDKIETQKSLRHANKDKKRGKCQYAARLIIGPSTPMLVASNLDLSLYLQSLKMEVLPTSDKPLCYRIISEIDASKKKNYSTGYEERI
jgi:hypothetical protein